MGTEEKRCCMKVETGTMIFAVINAVIWCLCISATLFALIAVNLFAAVLRYRLRDDSFDGLEARFTVDEEYEDGMYLILTNCALGICLFVSAINFIFAVLLCNGVSKKVPAHIKAYFIFGVVKVALLCSVNFAFIVCEGYFIGFVTFVFIVLYCLVLWMVYLTQVKFSAVDYNAFSHKRLVETVY